MRDKYLRTGGSTYHVEARLFYRVKGLEDQRDKDKATIEELENRINQLKQGVHHDQRTIAVA